MTRYTPKDFIEICFVFFRVVLYFLHILELYTIFWNYKQKWKTKKHCRTVLDRSRPVGLALLAWPTAISAWPAWARAAPSTRMVTATGAPAVMRLAGCVLGDKVLPTTTGTLPGDGPRRWGGRALTEAMWHRRGRRNGVDGGVRRRRRRSGDVLQQGEATGKVRGELNQSERLQRRRSSSRGGDGSGSSK
jgi:hypothetical protein